MSFLDDISYEDTPDGFVRTDLTAFREVLDNLKPNVTATIPVDTDQVKTYVRNFRKVAQERNVGLKVGKTTLPNGSTRLRLMLDKKREFSPEAGRKRDLALLKGRINKKVAGLMIEHPDWTQEVAQKHYMDNNKEVGLKLRALMTPPKP